MGWPIIRSIRETQAFALSLFPSKYIVPGRSAFLTVSATTKKLSSLASPYLLSA